MMKKLALIVLILFLNIIGFSQRSRVQNFKNQSIYEIKVGDTLRIYYTINSCCQYCITNRDKLQNIAFVDDIQVDRGEKNCEGCNRTYALLFVAENHGTDTIYGKIITASRSCSDSLIPSDKFIVHIK